MHIPDNYLSPKTCAVFAATVIPIIGYSAKKIKYEVKNKKETIPLMAIASSLSFLLMMFNIPLPGGTTAHAVGGCLLAVLIGPYEACIAITICLILQALLFGDGGILSLGVNIFNMAFVMPFSGYYIYSFLKKIFNEKGEIIGVAVGSYLSINIAAFLVAIELGIQPLIAKDQFNNPLYNPYPLSITIPAMVGAHVIIGIVESIFTVSVYKIVNKTSFNMENNKKESFIYNTKIKIRRFYKIIGVLIFLCPIGLIASGTAWGEWDVAGLAESLKSYNMTQSIPKGIESGISFSALFADYKILNIQDSIGYVLCAVTAITIFVLLYRVIFRERKVKL